jgi:hypothetical protein
MAKPNPAEVSLFSGAVGAVIAPLWQAWTWLQCKRFSARKTNLKTTRFQLARSLTARTLFPRRKHDRNHRMISLPLAFANFCVN